jgi:hypothetical protein
MKQRWLSRRGGTSQSTATLHMDHAHIGGTPPSTNNSPDGLCNDNDPGGTVTNFHSKVQTC